MNTTVTKPIEQMRLLKRETACIPPLGGKLFLNSRPSLGRAWSLFAEQIIAKYKQLADYGLEPAALVFLQLLSEEAEKRQELRDRTVQTLRLLVLWHRQQEVQDRLVCRREVYVQNLRREIELHLSFIRQLNLSQYYRLYRIYASDAPEQSLQACRQLLQELAPAGEKAGGRGIAHQFPYPAAAGRSGSQGAAKMPVFRHVPGAKPGQKGAGMVAERAGKPVTMLRSQHILLTRTVAPGSGGTPPGVPGTAGDKMAAPGGTPAARESFHPWPGMRELTHLTGGNQFFRFFPEEKSQDRRSRVHVHTLQVSPFRLGHRAGVPAGPVAGLLPAARALKLLAGRVYPAAARETVTKPLFLTPSMPSLPAPALRQEGPAGAGRRPWALPGKDTAGEKRPAVTGIPALGPGGKEVMRRPPAAGELRHLEGAGVPALEPAPAPETRAQGERKPEERSFHPVVHIDQTSWWAGPAGPAGLPAGALRELWQDSEVRLHTGTVSHSSTGETTWQPLGTVPARLPLRAVPAVLPPGVVPAGPKDPAGSAAPGGLQPVEGRPVVSRRFPGGFPPLVREILRSLPGGRELRHLVLREPGAGEPGDRPLKVHVHSEAVSPPGSLARRGIGPAVKTREFWRAKQRQFFAPHLQAPFLTPFRSFPEGSGAGSPPEGKGTIVLRPLLPGDKGAGRGFAKAPGRPGEGGLSSVGFAPGAIKSGRWPGPEPQVGLPAGRLPVMSPAVRSPGSMMVLLKPLAAGDGTGAVIDRLPLPAGGQAGEDRYFRARRETAVSEPVVREVITGELRHVSLQEPLVREFFQEQPSREYWPRTTRGTGFGTSVGAERGKLWSYPVSQGEPRIREAVAGPSRDREAGTMARHGEKPPAPGRAVPGGFWSGSGAGRVPAVRELGRERQVKLGAETVYGTALQEAVLRRPWLPATGRTAMLAGRGITPSGPLIPVRSQVTATGRTAGLRERRHVLPGRGELTHLSFMEAPALPVERPEPAGTTRKAGLGPLRRIGAAGGPAAGSEYAGSPGREAGRAGISGARWSPAVPLPGHDKVPVGERSPSALLSHQLLKSLAVFHLPGTSGAGQAFGGPVPGDGTVGSPPAQVPEPAAGIGPGLRALQHLSPAPEAESPGSGGRVGAPVAGEVPEQAWRGFAGFPPSAGSGGLTAAPGARPVNHLYGTGRRGSPPGEAGSRAVSPGISRAMVPVARPVAGKAAGSFHPGTTGLRLGVPAGHRGTTSLRGPGAEVLLQRASQRTQRAVMELEYVDRIHYQGPAGTGTGAATGPATGDLVERFGNLLADPNLPPGWTMDQSGSLFAGSGAGSGSRPLSMAELVKRFMESEHLLRQEQRKVTELTQKLKEQETVIYKLQHAHSRLQEDVAAKLDEKKIKSLVLKELRERLRLEKMRYGWQ